MVAAKSEYILSDDGAGAAEKDPLKDVPVSSGYDVKPTMTGAGTDPPFATPPTSAEYPAPPPPPPPPPPTHHLSSYSPYHSHPHSHHYAGGHPISGQQQHQSGAGDLGASFPYSSSPSSSSSLSSSRPPMGNSNSSSASSITGSSSTGSAGSIGGGGMPPLQAAQQKAGKAKNRPNAGQFTQN